MASTFSSKRLLLGAGLALVFVLLIALYVFLKQTDNTLVYFMLLVVLALTSAMLTTFFRGRINYTEGPISSTGDYAIFILVIFVGLSFYAWNYYHPQSFGFTVFVRDTHQQTVLRTGSLQLLVGNSRPEEAIDPSGSAFFRDVPAAFRNTMVRVELLGNEEFQFTNGSKVDTLELTGQAATVIVEPDRQRCCLTGIVIDQNGEAVVNAQVWTGTLTPVKTDSLGRFKLVLSAEKRIEENFEVFVRKGKVQRHVRMDHIQVPTIELPLKQP